MAELTTLARPYAKAAFQYALAANDLAGWAEHLATLAGASQYGAMRQVISSPSLSAQQQVEKLVTVCGDLPQPVQNFVTLLAENKRLALLPAIESLFAELKNQQEQAVEVELIAARELDDASQQKLAQALSAKLSREVKINTSVDADLMAGVIIKAGDLVIDGSMRGRVEKLAKAINS